jgi:hypothetical protein
MTDETANRRRGTVREKPLEIPTNGANLATRRKNEPGDRPAMQISAYSFALDLRVAKIQLQHLLVITSPLSHGISERDAFRHS